VKETKIYVQLVCPDCHCDLFHVYEEGAIICSECECEIVAEENSDEPITIH